MTASEAALRDRVTTLEAAINSVLDQSMDDICWLDVYLTLGKLVGREYDPVKLPRHVFEGNCQRFAASLYDGKPYDKDSLTEVVAEHHKAKQLLRDAGFGVTGTPLLATVMEALTEIKSLRDTVEEARQEGMDRDLLT